MCKPKVLSNVRIKARGFALRLITFVKITKVEPLATHSQETLFNSNKVGVRVSLAYAKEAQRAFFHGLSRALARQILPLASLKGR